MSSTNTILKCPYCGNRENLTAVNEKYSCESCNTIFWIEEHVGSEEHSLLLRANQDRIEYMQYEKAIEGYDAVIKKNPNNITALWGRFLAEYA
jgi:DNA-directed RNA polymerase subunit RPC12/RpoP